MNGQEEQNKQLVTQRIGAVALTSEQFTQDQMVLFNKVMGIVDRSPVLHWKRGDNNHNQDFCIIEGKVEPVKNFCLKCQFQAGLTMANTGQQVTGSGQDTRVICTVRVTAPDGRSVEMAGASSEKECGGGRDKVNARAFHDAVARAQTRAFKLAVEAIMGFPFINMALKELFGAYEIKGEDDPLAQGVTPRDVTETGNTEPTPEKTGTPKGGWQVAGKKKSIGKYLREMRDKHGYSVAWVNEWWVRVEAAGEDMDRLSEIHEEINTEVMSGG